MAPPASFPELRTRRLRLRAIAPDDVAAFVAILAPPEVTRFSDWPDAPDAARLEKVLARFARLHETGGGCAWAIERDGAVAGAIRINWINPAWRCGGMGYESHPRHWGQGLMTEALRAVAACAHGDFGLNRIEAWTLPGNGASDRVLEKAGFLFEGTRRQQARFKGAFHDFRMFARLASDPLPEAD